MAIANYQRSISELLTDVVSTSTVLVRKETQLAGDAAIARGVGENILERREARAFRRTQRLSGRRRLAKIAHGRERGADVEHAIFPDRDD